MKQAETDTEFALYKILYYYILIKYLNYAWFHRIENKL